MRRLVLAALCLGAASLPAAAFRMHGGITTASATQAIIAVTPSTGSFAGGTGSANQLVFTAAATMFPASPSFSGTWAISGTDNGKFKIDASTGALTVCNTAPTCSDLANGTYHINVVATQGGATGSPFMQAVTITGQDATFIATDTFKEIAHADQAANWPLQRGMAFKYGAVNPAIEHVEIRVASGATCNGALLDYQWDEIATRNESGLGWFAEACRLYGSAPRGPRQPIRDLGLLQGGGSLYAEHRIRSSLANLCSAHPLAMDFNNLKNQDQFDAQHSGPRSGSCAATSQRPAAKSPIQYADGQIRKGWIIRGEPVYTSGGNKDPLLYVMAYVDVFSVPGNINTIDRIKHVLRPVEWLDAGCRGHGWGCRFDRLQRRRLPCRPRQRSADGVLHTEVARRGNGDSRLRCDLLADDCRPDPADEHRSREHDQTAGSGSRACISGRIISLGLVTAPS